MSVRSDNWNRKEMTITSESGRVMEIKRHEGGVASKEREYVILGPENLGSQAISNTVSLVSQRGHIGSSNFQ